LQVKAKCEALKLQGNLVDEQKVISERMGRLVELLDSDNLESKETELAEIVQKIAQTSISMKAKLDSKFADISLQQAITWKISWRDFQHRLPLVNHSQLGWKLKRIEIEKFMSGGVEQVLPKSAWTILVDDHAGLVRLNRPASLLEVCQLQKTLGVVVQVTFANGQLIENRKFLLYSENMEAK
jgi:hypothetical protein